MVPNEPILVARYQLTNLTNEERTVSLMELVDLNNLSMGVPSGSPGDSGVGTSSSSAGQSIGATWYPDYNAWIADMSQTNGTYLLFGAFFPAASHAAGAPASDQALGKGSNLLAQFENQGALQDNGQIDADDILLAISDRLSLAPGQTQEVAFYYSAQDGLASAEAVAQKVQATFSAEEWFVRTHNAWQQWLSSGRSTVSTGDPGVDQAYTRELIVLRQSQQPEFGTILASTNPNYNYNVWPRDASISAMSLDAAGYFSEAERFWMWMAGVQATGPGNFGDNPGIEDFPNGTWYTNYGYWNRKETIDFVQPEWDSVGQFLIGVYHHWKLLEEANPDAAQNFLNAIYPSVVDSAEWISGNVRSVDLGGTGFGPPGYSVWEEDYQYAVYTQVTYASGLNAARLLAQQKDEQARAQDYLNDALTIRGNLRQAIGTGDCGGMWDPDQKYFIRGIFPPETSSSGDCEPDMRVDGSTNLIWVFGLIPADDPLAQSHRQEILNVLAPPITFKPDAGAPSVSIDPQADYGLGISRYDGDVFYYSSDFNPGGGKYASTVPMPSWPWMSSYMSMAEHWLGLDELSFARLQWYVSVTGVGFMPTGEVVDWHTQQPLVSTMSQPDDGGYNMQIALLNYLGLFDPRLPPLD